MAGSSDLENDMKGGEEEAKGLVFLVAVYADCNFSQLGWLAPMTEGSLTD